MRQLNQRGVVMDLPVPTSWKTTISYKSRDVLRRKKVVDDCGWCRLDVAAWYRYKRWSRRYVQ